MSQNTMKFGLIKYSNPDICMFCKSLHGLEAQLCSTMFHSNKEFQITKKNIYKNFKKLHPGGKEQFILSTNKYIL